MIHFRIVRFLVVCSFTLLSHMAFAASPEILQAFEENKSRYHEQLPSQDIEGAIDLKIVSLNLGLLARPEVPNFAQRSRILSQQLSGFLKKEHPDLVFFQEAWDDIPENLKRIRDVAKENNYISMQEVYESIFYFGGFQTHNGLEILIKKSILKDESAIRDLSFSSIERTTLAAMFGYQRGVLHATISLESDRKVLIGTSHFTPNLGGPFYDQDPTRRLQSQQTSAILKQAGSEADYIVFGGDLNFSPEFEHKIQDGRESDAEDALWEASSMSYPIFLRESGLIDAFKIINSDTGYTQDRVLNPMANISPSTDGEPEQRLDYIWVGSYKSDRALKVLSADIVFDQALLDSTGKVIVAEQYDGPLFMSDHFGVTSEVTIY